MTVIAEVLLVPAYRRPGEMGNWWYAAIGSDDDQGHCTVGRALMPGMNTGVSDWDTRFVWELHHPYPGYVDFINKKTRRGIYFAGRDQPVGGAGMGATDEMWSLGGPIDKYSDPGFAIRPYHDVDQNLNAYEAFRHGHNGLVGATVCTWGWGHGEMNETWALLRVDPLNGHPRQSIIQKLDANGWPDVGA